MKTGQQLVKEILPQIKEVTVEQLKAVQNDENNLIIDVREPQEFQERHIDGAVSMPRGVLEMKIHTHPSVSNLNEPSDALNELAKKDLYLICRTGGRSALAAHSLQQMGFTNVYSVKGGMTAWQD
jgi:rhodanese-related sulfurtransferase